MCPEEPEIFIWWAAQITATQMQRPCISLDTLKMVTSLFFTSGVMNLDKVRSVVLWLRKNSRWSWIQVVLSVGTRGQENLQNFQYTMCRSLSIKLINTNY